MSEGAGGALYGLSSAEQRIDFSAYSSIPDQTHHKIKIVVVGNEMTGKTSFIKRFVTGEFEDEYKQTMKVDIYTKNIKMIDTRRKTVTVKVELHDIMGQQSTFALLPTFLRNAHAALIVFDVMQPKTLEAVADWKKPIDELAFPGTEKDKIPALLLANKVDLLTHGKLDAAATVTLSTFCEDTGFISYQATSVKENNGVNEAIILLVEQVLAKLATIESKEDPAGLVDISKHGAPRPSDGCQC